MIHVAVTGCTGYIGKKVCHILKKYKTLYVLEVDRKGLSQLDTLMKTHKIHVFIHLIHDFKHPENNILILRQLYTHFKNNYFPYKFIYLSSWVTLFTIGYSDAYYKSKLECEEYIQKNMQHYIVLRPPLVCSKNNIWTNRLILLCSFGYYIHVNELSFLILDYIQGTNVNIIRNVQSHYFSKNIFHEKFTKQIQFLPKTFGFFAQNIQFERSTEKVSFQCLLYQHITSLEDVRWVTKYFRHEYYEICGFQNSYAIRHRDPPNMFGMLNYNKILHVNEDTITVQAGLSIEQMLDFLKSRGKTIEHIPFYCNVSVAASLKTTIHGISTTSSCVASCVNEFVTIHKQTSGIFSRWKGTDIHNIDNDDIIVQITFTIIPLVTIQVESSTIKESILTMDTLKMEEYFTNNYAVCLTWNKFNNKTHLTQYNITSEKPVSTKSPFVRRHVPYLNHHWNNKIVLDYNNAFNEYKYVFLEKFFMSLRKNSIVNMEVYFPITKLSLFKSVLQTYLDSIYSILLRFTRVDPIIFYPDTDIICWVDLITDPVHANQFIDSIKNNPILADAIQFHSGKYHH